MLNQHQVGIACEIRLEDMSHEMHAAFVLRRDRGVVMQRKAENFSVLNQPVPRPHLLGDARVYVHSISDRAKTTTPAHICIASESV